MKTSDFPSIRQNLKPSRASLRLKRWVWSARRISPEGTVEGAILKHPSEMLTTES